MKEFLKEYLEIIIYAVCGILIIFSSYTIIININHARYLNKTILISDLDGDYKNYKENVIKIEKIINEKENN